MISNYLPACLLCLIEVDTSIYDMLCLEVSQLALGSNSWQFITRKSCELQAVPNSSSLIILNTMTFFPTPLLLVAKVRDGSECHWCLDCMFGKFLRFS